MALKNDETIPALGKRILDLMEEKHYESPKALATVLYDQQLVPVNTRTHDNDEYDIRLSSIGSIEKKIVRHIKTGQISDTTGQFILAYCKTFDCSSDYLLGLTDIRSANIEIRRIAELTGLEEEAVKNLVFTEEHDFIDVSRWWSYILKDSLFLSIPYQLSEAERLIPEQHHIEDVLIMTKQKIDQCPQEDEDEMADLIADYIEYRDRLISIRPSIQGILFKISRELADILEKEILRGFQSLWTQKNEQDLYSI